LPALLAKFYCSRQERNCRPYSKKSTVHGRSGIAGPTYKTPLFTAGAESPAPLTKLHCSRQKRDCRPYLDNFTVRDRSGIADPTWTISLCAAGAGLPALLRNFHFSLQAWNLPAHIRTRARTNKCVRVHTRRHIRARIQTHTRKRLNIHMRIGSYTHFCGSPTSPCRSLSTRAPASLDQ